MITQVTALLLTAQVLAQAPTSRTLRQCWLQGQPSRFCVPSDGSSTSAIQGAQPAQGWCCAEGSTDAKCVTNDDVTCTLNNKGQMDLSLWQTYWPGINEEVCNDGASRKLTATDELQTFTPTSLVISSRQADQGYTEACYWTVEADQQEWHSNAEIWIYLDQATSSEMRVFSGSERPTTSLSIESNSVMAVGAPVRIPITSSATITMQITPPQRTGSGTFSYKVVGNGFKWYERPFNDKSKAAYYSFLVALSIALALILVYVCASTVSTLPILLAGPLLTIVSVTVWPVILCLLCLLCCRKKVKQDSKPKKEQPKKDSTKRESKPTRAQSRQDLETPQDGVSRSPTFKLKPKPTKKQDSEDFIYGSTLESPNQSRRQLNESPNQSGRQLNDSPNQSGRQLNESPNQSGRKLNESAVQPRKPINQSPEKSRNATQATVDQSGTLNKPEQRRLKKAEEPPASARVRDEISKLKQAVEDEWGLQSSKSPSPRLKGQATLPTRR